MSEEAMRKALEAAKNELIPLLEPNNPACLTPKGIADVEIVIGQIDEALKSEPAENPDDRVDAFQQTKQGLRDLIEECLIAQSGGRIRNQLLNLPDAIKDQQLEVALISSEIEKLCLLIAHSRNIAFELISGIKEEDKLKYSNEKARTVAQEAYLAEDKAYLENCDKLGRQEWQLKVEQIELDFLRDSFKATLAISQMGQVR